MRQVDINFFNPKTKVLYLEKSDGKHMRLHEMIVQDTFIHIEEDGRTTVEYILREGLRSTLGWIDRAPGEAVFKYIEDVTKSPYARELMRGTDGKIDLILDFAGVTEEKLQESIKLSKQSGTD